MEINNLVYSFSANLVSDFQEVLFLLRLEVRICLDVRYPAQTNRREKRNEPGS